MNRFVRMTGACTLLLLSPFLRADGCGDKGSDDSGGNRQTTTGSTTGSTTGTTGTGTGAATATATGTGTGTGGAVTDCSGDLCIHYDPATMQKVHEIGVSNCPDPLGQVEVQNNSSEVASFTFSAPNPPPYYSPGILFPHPTIPDYYEPSIASTIPANSTAIVPFFFSCYTQTSFADDVTVEVSSMTDLLVTTVPVDMTIQ